MSFLEIRIKGRIDPHLSEWFQGMTIQPVSAQESCLRGEVADNSAIYGILSSLSGLGLTLISVSVKEEIDETG